MNTTNATNRKLRRMCANILSIVVVLTMAFPVTGSAYAADEPSPFNLHIRAYIDGYSQLVVQGSNVYWHHIGAAAPGRWLLVDEPTYLNGTAWYPTWPDIPDAENRDCNCDSSTFGELNHPLPEGQSFRLDVINARWSAYISQQPTADNGYTLVIDFDDGPPGGADWYEVELVQGEPLMQGEHWGTDGIAHPNGCNAFGWAQDPDDAEGEAQVRILADDVEIANGETYEHGFYFNLWGLISNYADHIIKAQAFDPGTGQWINLTYTPKMLNCVNYDIYVVNVKDGTAERLTMLDDTGEYNPSWSPDGQKVVHDVTNADFHALYITDVKTHASNELLGGDGGNDAAWSPNGKWIVFDRSPYGDTNLYILPPTGGELESPIVSDATNGDWSPDSKRLVFQRGDGIWTASAKGGDEKQVVEAGYNPVWSPNGMWIAYDLDGDIYKVRVNKDGVRNGDPIKLTSGPASDGGATWSRDNKQVAFASDISGDHDIWQISAEGGSPARLISTNIYGDYDPGYNNTGQYIAYDGAKEPAQPYIVAFPEWGYIEGQDWPINDVVHLTVDDPATDIKPDYEAEQPTVANDWGTWWVQFNFDYDLKIGDRVTETDGYLTRTYTIRNLTVRGASEQADLVTGDADPGEVVYVWAWDRDESYRELIAGPDGTWMADYSAVDFNLEIGMCGRAEVRDKIGNRTAVDWCVRNPRIVASESGNWFWTTDFFPGMLDISIYESADEDAPLLWHGQREADQGGFVMVDDHGVDLVEGNYLVISDGVNHKELVLQPISINVFDTWGEAMAGTAPAGSEVWAAAGPQDWQERIQVQTDPVSGAWLADFTTIGFDITEEMWPWSYVHLYDEDGDANEGSTPPSPRVVVQITDDWFRAENFTPYGELTFWIYDAEGNLLRHPEQTWQLDENGYITISMWELNEFLDLIPGYQVVVSDGGFTKDIVLEAFTFATFDLTTGQLSGTAPAPSGRAIWTGIGWQDQGAWLRYVTSDGTGAWLADFGTPVPSDYWWVAAQIFDDDGDASELRPELVLNDWVIAFSYDFIGYWSEGEHKFHMEAEWPGGGDVGQDRFFTVSSLTDLYSGYVLLRPFGLRARMDDGTCPLIDPVIHTNQLTRFHIGYGSAPSVTYEDALAGFSDLKVWVVWDDGERVPLVAREIVPFDQWPQYMCSFTEP